jgi:hypothetical protein
MTVFEFELSPVESIEPWGEPGRQELHWFGLSLGTFRIDVGKDVLLRYTEEILSHWGTHVPYADYQIAAFARDVLGSVAAGAARLPTFFEQIAADPSLLQELRFSTTRADLDRDIAYTASRWIGERSPWFSYLVGCPEFAFIRIKDEIHIDWDNRRAVVDGIPVWTATQGTHVLPVDSFRSECRSFAERLLESMDARISSIESGSSRPRVPVDTVSLRDQQRTWRDELASYFRDYEPDVAWDRAEAAVRALAETAGWTLPT